MNNPVFDRLVDLARNLAEDVHDIDMAYVSDTCAGRERMQAESRVELEYRETLRKIDALEREFSDE